jgi:hypothetical protein
MGQPFLKPNYRYKINVKKIDVLNALHDIDQKSQFNWELFLQNEEELLDHLDNCDGCNDELYGKIFEIMDLLEEKEIVSEEMINSIECVCFEADDDN